MFLGIERNFVWFESIFFGGYIDWFNLLCNVRIKEFDFYFKRDFMVRRRIKK